MIGQEDLLSPELPSSPVGNEFPGGRLPLGLSSLTSHLNPRGNMRPRIMIIIILSEQHFYIMCVPNLMPQEVDS